MIPSISEALAAAAAGTRLQGNLPVGTMASGAEIFLPYVALKGSAEGPCLWINGQVHGDEINGIVAAFDFMDSIDPRELKGHIVLTTTSNPFAFNARSKNAPQDGYDLDQSFPGNARGFITERVARTLYDNIIGCASVLINMHTMPTFFQARPYAVFKQDLDGRIDEQMLIDYLAGFNPALACLVSVDPGRGERLGNLAGALDHQMLLAGIPSFMVELGNGGVLNEDHVAQGVAGFRHVASRMGMLPPGEAGQSTPSSLTKVIRRARITFDHGGIFRALKQPGDIVPAGEPLGRLLDLYGRTKQVLTLPEDCLIIGIRRDPVVHTGDWFVFVALEWERVDLHST